jgi:4-amino-4-deoxy-L-arabinose transferase-like glycosyltransferase
VYCTRLSGVPFTPDESHWVATSAVFEAYVTGDSDSPLWDESYATLTQPPLPRYVIGLGRRLGGFEPSELNDLWDFSKEDRRNYDKGRQPTEPLLWWSRLPMGMLAAGSIFAWFLLLKRYGGSALGFTWLGLCLVSAYFPLILRRAMAEPVLLAGLTLVMLACCKLLQDPHASQHKPAYRSLLGVLIVGIGIGLAQSAKLNGISMLGAGAACAVVLALEVNGTWTARLRFLALALAVLVGASQLTFMALNPFLWPDPLSRTAAMFAQRLEELHEQQAQLPEASMGEGLPRAWLVIRRVLQDYAALHFPGAFLLNAPLFALGFAHVARQALRSARRQRPAPVALSILFVGAAAAVPALFTPLDWDRYYLLPVYFSTMLIAVGAWLALSAAHRSWTRARATTSHRA